jgi:hypothetical protein
MLKGFALLECDACGTLFMHPKPAPAGNYDAWMAILNRLRQMATTNGWHISKHLHVCEDCCLDNLLSDEP